MTKLTITAKNRNSLDSVTYKPRTQDLDLDEYLERAAKKLYKRNVTVYPVSCGNGVWTGTITNSSGCVIGSACFYVDQN